MITPLSWHFEVACAIPELILRREIRAGLESGYAQDYSIEKIIEEIAQGAKPVE